MAAQDKKVLVTGGIGEARAGAYAGAGADVVITGRDEERGRQIVQSLVDVRLDLLVPTDTVSHCPYKGDAGWWSVRTGNSIHDELAWSYRAPLPESQKIAGLIAFYNEKTDIYLDGVLQQRPSTKFS